MSLVDQLLADLDDEAEDDLENLVKKEEENDDQIDEAMEIGLTGGVYDKVTDVAKLTSSIE